MELNLSTPNSQSFDEVLQKLKQSMKAARSGGWIDSDSGSELEIPLDHHSHSPNSNNGHLDGHPCARGIVTRPTNQQHLVYIKDGMDHQRRGDVEDKSEANSALAPTPLWANSKSISPRASDLNTRPLTASSLKYHSVDPNLASYPQESRIPHPFDAPASPYGPRTPSTPASLGTSSGSPYVRHHFKWEYLPPSTTIGEGLHLPGSQPRFVESSSPPLKINHDDPHSDWSWGFLPKELILPTESSQRQPSIDSRYNFEIQTPSSNSTHFPPTMLNGYRSVSYSPTHDKSQSIPPQNPGSGYTHRMPELENMDSSKPGSFEPTQKPWLVGGQHQEHKLCSQTLINPASVSSVSFSLAPAASIRLTAPEGDSQLKSFGRKGTPGSSPREINPPMAPRESHPTRSASPTSVCLKDLAQEKEKEVIRARLMGSSSIDSFHTRLQNSNKSYGAISALTDADHSMQPSNLPSLFQQMRFSNTAQPISSSKARMQSVTESAPLRSFSASFPVNHSYGAPIFYSSHQPHPGAGSRHGSFAAPSSMTSSPNNLSPMAQLTPRTPITPSGFGINAHLHAPGSNAPYPPTPSANKPSFVPVVVPAVPGIGGAVGAPLPGQVQPEEVRKSVKTQPPVVNTGNSGAMIPQPGDWMCICGFVNWRRRKVCMRCFPFADGNDSVGAMMAINAQRAALLAAGIPVTKEHSSSTSVISNCSPTLFHSTETLPYQEVGNQLADQQAKLHRIFGSPEPVFNYGRAVEQTGVFKSPAPRGSLNPFDKSSPLGPISPAPGTHPHYSPTGENGERYPDEFSQSSLDRDDLGDCTTGLPEKSPKVLRARLVAPGYGQHTEPNTWEESRSKSPRPRSFSMGAKSVWESHDDMQVGGAEAGETRKSNQSDQNPIGKETNGIPRLEEAVGAHVVSGRLGPDRHQELNTINNSNSNGTNVNRQRTITSPSSSWQAIKVLWQ